MQRGAYRAGRVFQLTRARLRAVLLRARGAKIGAKCLVGSRPSIGMPWGVSTGSRVVIEDDVTLKLEMESSRLRLASFVFVGRGSQFDIIDTVEVGDSTLIGPRCFITDHNHGIQEGELIRTQKCKVSPVTIGKDVWIGTNVVVLPGVTIGDGAVVGANSVVVRAVGNNEIVAGSPAVRIGSRVGHS